jgi:hypothetical protein
VLPGFGIHYCSYRNSVAACKERVLAVKVRLRHGRPADRNVPTQFSLHRKSSTAHRVTSIRHGPSALCDFALTLWEGCRHVQWSQLRQAKSGRQCCCCYLFVYLFIVGLYSEACRYFGVYNERERTWKEAVVA